MADKTAAVGRWHYSEPALHAGTDGSIVVFSKASVAPAEIYEWGFDAERRPFARYRWCEDDFYEACGYDKTISAQELINGLEEAAAVLKEHGDIALSEQYEEMKTQILSGSLP